MTTNQGALRAEFPEKAQLKQIAQEARALFEDPVYPLREYLRDVARISRSLFYKEQSEGTGVEFFRRGDKIYVRLSAHLRHMEQLELRAAAEREQAQSRRDAEKAAAAVTSTPATMGLRRKRGRPRKYPRAEVA